MDELRRSAKIKACQFDTPMVGNMESFREVSSGGELKIDVAVNAVAYASAMIGLQALRWRVLGYDGEELPLAPPCSAIWRRST